MTSDTAILARLPVWLSHWLGYRAQPPTHTPRHIVWLWSFIGAFGGLSVIQAVFGHAHYFVERDVPTIIASYGASAVLIYGVVDAPLAQPRSVVGSHLIASITGVSFAKLFRLSDNFERIRWLGGSLSASTTTVLMQMTAMTHPPAGALALLAVVDDQVVEIGWYLVAVTVLSDCLCIALALLINNIQRRYTIYWWKPVPRTPSQSDPNDGSTIESKFTREGSDSAVIIDHEHQRDRP